MSSCDLTPICPTTVSQALNRMKSLRLFSTQFTTDQLTWLFRGMCQDTRLDRLSINLKYLDRTKDVLPELVGGGLANIASLNIHELNKQFVPLQIIDFFERLGQDSRVESLTLQTADLAYIEKTVLAKALTSVRRLTLGLVTLTSEQATEFCRELKKKGSKLQHLDVNTNKMALDTVLPHILASGLASLETVSLSYTGLQGFQSQALLEQLAKEESKVSSLCLCSNNLSGVSPDTLAQALEGLQALNLRDCGLSEEQGEAVLEALGSSDSLSQLDLADNRLSRVEPATVARALNRVRTVGVAKCSLTLEQLTAVLEEARLYTRTAFLDIEGNNTANLPSSLLQEVARRTEVSFSRKKKQLAVKKWCPACQAGPFVRLGQHRCRLAG